MLENLIKKYCEDADVVHHLAGVTDVPRTKSEASSAQDEKIKEVGEKGTQNILDVISNKCKIIFRIYLELELRLCKGGGDLSAVEALEKRFYEMYPNDLMLEGLNGIRYRYNTLGLSPDGDDESSNGDGNVGQTSSSSYMYTNMADPLFNSERVKVVGVPVADGNGVDNEKYLCVPAFLGKLTTYLPILSQSINPLQDVKNVLETFRSMPIPEKPDGYDKYLEEKTKHISNQLLYDLYFSLKRADKNWLHGNVNMKRDIFEYNEKNNFNI